MPRYRRWGFVLCLLVLVSGSVSALDVPPRPDRYVTDLAHLLTPGMRTQLEALLQRFERHTTNQVVILTLPSLEGEEITDFTMRVAEAWKVGQADRENGVIFCIAPTERRMRIEVGYGLEGALPDALGGQIITQQVGPYFREGQFDQGVKAGIDAILGAIHEEYRAPGQRGHTRAGAARAPTLREVLRPEDVRRGLYILTVIVVLFFGLDFWRYRQYGQQHKTHRGRFTFWEWWFRFAVLFFILQLIFRVAFYAMLMSRGGSYGGRSGFGGFRGGGGSFGGGGASGGW